MGKTRSRFDMRKKEKESKNTKPRYYYRKNTKTKADRVLWDFVQKGEMKPDRSPRFEFESLENEHLLFESDDSYVVCGKLNHHYLMGSTWFSHLEHEAWGEEHSIFLGKSSMYCGGSHTRNGFLPKSVLWLDHKGVPNREKGYLASITKVFKVIDRKSPQFVKDQKMAELLKDKPIDACELIPASFHGEFFVMSNFVREKKRSFVTLNHRKCALSDFLKPCLFFFIFVNITNSFHCLNSFSNPNVIRSRSIASVNVYFVMIISHVSVLERFIGGCKPNQDNEN